MKTDMAMLPANDNPAGASLDPTDYLKFVYHTRCQKIST